MSKKILIIDDEQRMRRILQLLLEDNDYMVKTARDGLEGMAVWKEFDPHVVLTDIKMPKADGLQVLEFKNKNYLKAPLIMLTAFGTIEKAVFAMKQGAFNYLTKPFKNADVIKVIRKAMLESESKLSQRPVKNKIIGSSKAVRKILQDIAVVANTRTSVLITGESGTGKELVAQSIHASGDRRQKPMVKVNCSAIPGDLLESELFGHVKGSFTGAISDRPGSFQKADTGILFLDEIGDLPMNLQPKLLHAVEDKTITPIGSSKIQTIDVKIISASNRDFPKMMDSGEFRSDLYFRLNAFNIHLPPLKKRREDIDELTCFFIEYFSKAFKKPVTNISRQAIDLLKTHKWPGNIRELRNVIERAVLTCSTSGIHLKDLPENLKNILDHSEKQIAKTDLDLETKQKQLIINALLKTGGNQVQAAKLLHISRNTLRYRLKKYGI
jgi:two-component system NtrC family response regulator